MFNDFRVIPANVSVLKYSLILVGFIGQFYSRHIRILSFSVLRVLILSQIKHNYMQERRKNIKNTGRKLCYRRELKFDKTTHWTAIFLQVEI